MNCDIAHSNNKDKIAIVVVGYNRLNSTKRLLNSLINSNYSSNDVPLVISIDCSENEQLYKYVREFQWPFGEKYVNIETKRLGLKDHIFQCGNLTEYFKAVIILEDDIFVAPDFYNYTIAAVNKYYFEKSIAGIALYSEEMYGFVGVPFTPLQNGSDSFVIQAPVTSGECFTDLMWNDFNDWYIQNKNIDMSPLNMPERIKHWKRAWSVYYHAYLLEKNKYFLIPYLSLSTNCGEAGEHGGNINSIHVNLFVGIKKYIFFDFDNIEKYDVFANNVKLADYLKNIDRNDLCVDFYGDKKNRTKKKYWLTTLEMPYKKISSFGLILSPQELNVIYNISGEDIFLYDTSIKNGKMNEVSFNSRILSYYIQGFDYKLLSRYLYFVYKKIIVNKVRKLFGLKIEWL